MIAAEFICHACRNRIRIYEVGLKDHYERVAKMVKEWCRMHRSCQKVKRKRKAERVLREVEQVLKREEERAVKEAERIIRVEQKKASEQKGFQDEPWYKSHSRNILRQFLTDDEIEQIMGGEG